MDDQMRIEHQATTVLHDVERALQRVKDLRREADLLDTKRHSDVRVLRIKELVGDLQARLEGIEAFVESCQQRKRHEEAPPEEIDLWM